MWLASSESALAPPSSLTTSPPSTVQSNIWLCPLAKFPHISLRQLHAARPSSCTSISMVLFTMKKCFGIHARAST